MPLPLSYPGLKCVLENLEAVKRAHIICRSPGLQKIDKLIPLCLENLNINRNEITVNKIKIKCDKDEVKFETKGKMFIRKGLGSQEEAVKKIFKFYFCEKSITRVDELNWCDSLFPDVLALGMKFGVNVLCAPFRHNLETAIPFIDFSSFPLKTLVIIPADHLIFDIQAVKLAKHLILYLVVDRILTIEDLKKLNNKAVVFNYSGYYRVDNMIPLIKCHIETKKVVETTFIISTNRMGPINEMLRNFELAFGEFRSDLDGVNERFIPGSSKFSIPINNESRIQVYAIKDPEEGGRLKIVIKPVPGL